jgi:hypothetical protein
MRAVLSCVLVMISGMLSPAVAQAVSRPAPAVEFAVGHAGFVDDSTVDGWMTGGAVRFHLSPRISVGPEVQFMFGPDDDRSSVITANLIADFLAPGTAGRPRTTPYLVAGGGWFRNTTQVGTGSFTSGDPAFTAGAGVRLWFNRRIYLAPEVRLQWELHFRISGTIGVALG